SVKPIRLMRTRLPLEVDTGKICGPELLCRLQGPGSVCSGRLFVNCREQGCQLRSAVDYSEPQDHRQPARAHRYSSSSCCTTRCADSSYRLFPKIPYRSGTSSNDPTQGP